MLNNKSTITLNLTIDSESDSAPTTCELVYPNLKYEQVLMIERCFIDMLTAMNDKGEEAVVLLSKPTNPNSK